MKIPIYPIDKLLHYLTLQKKAQLDEKWDIYKERAGK